MNFLNQHEKEKEPHYIVKVCLFGHLSTKLQKKNIVKKKYKTKLKLYI